MEPSFLSREEARRAGKKVGDAVAQARPTGARPAKQRGGWGAVGCSGTSGRNEGTQTMRTTSSEIHPTNVKASIDRSVFR